MVMSSTAFPQKHSGWTMHDLAELPDDGHRYEIVDGQRVMMAPVSLLHQGVARRLSDVLTPAFGSDFYLFENVAVDLHPTYRIPDLTVFRKSAYRPLALTLAPSEIVLLVEIVSPGSKTNARITKPAEYAAIGIPNYWRIEIEDQLSLTAYVLADGATTYTELGTWAAGETADLTQPVTVRIVIGDLAPS